MATQRRLMHAGVACLIVLTALVVSAPIGVANQVTELEGTWVGVKSTVGEAERAFKEGELWLSFSGTTLEAKGLLGPQVAKLDVVIDPKQKHLNYTRKVGEIVECLYRLDGDTLILAVPRASTTRPREISPTSADSVLLYLTRKR